MTSRNRKRVSYWNSSNRSFKSLLLLGPKEYDYLILGAGRAGCVMANRLTEVPDNKVMVLELGQEATSVSKVPALTAYAKFSKFSRTRCLKPQDDFGLACSVSTTCSTGP